MAGLAAVEPDIAARGAGLAVIGNARPDAIAGFRDATGYRGVLLVDPSLASYRVAGLRTGVTTLLDPRMVPLAIRAYRGGFRQGTLEGRPTQQGGILVLGPGDVLRFARRDRFAGDHAPIGDVLAALGAASRV